MIWSWVGGLYNEDDIKWYLKYKLELAWLSGIGSVCSRQRQDAVQRVVIKGECSVLQNLKSVCTHVCFVTFYSWVSINFFKFLISKKCTFLHS